MTSSTFDTIQFQKYSKAIHHLYNKFKEGKPFPVSSWTRDFGINSHTIRALRNLGAITDANINPVRWTHKNKEFKTDEVDNKFVQIVIDEVKRITRIYEDKKKEKGKSEKKVTQAVIKKEECSYHSLEHQLVFVNGQLEKEKQVKGYLRQDEVNFLKGIKVNLEKFKVFKELAVENL